MGNFRKSMDRLKRFMRLDTLKGQLISMLLLSAILPFVLISGEAIYSIISILENKIHKGAPASGDFGCVLSGIFMHFYDLAIPR